MFVKGISGNPGGKPNLTPSKKKQLEDVKAAAREWSTQSIKTLGAALTAKGCPWSVRVTAANALLDRGYGKPKESLDVKMTGATLEELVMASFKQPEPQTIEGKIVPDPTPSPAQPSDLEEPKDRWN